MGAQRVIDPVIATHMREVKGMPWAKIGDHWGLSAHAAMMAVKRHKEKLERPTSDPWGDRLPWRVASHHKSHWLYRRLVMEIKDREKVALPEEDLGALMLFRAKLAKPRKDAPHGVVLVYNEEEDLFLVRPREPEEDQVFVPR